MIRSFLIWCLAWTLAFMPIAVQAADVHWDGSFQFFDSDGNPLAGGKITTYDAGTTSSRTVYQDSGEATPHTNPIILDSAGRVPASVFVPTGSWKYVLTNSADVTVETVDDLPGALDTSAFTPDFAKPQEPVSAITANYTVATTDLGTVLNGDSTGGAFAISLISAVIAGDGKRITVRKSDSSANAVSVSASGGELINGSGSTLTLTAQNQLTKLVSDGANWHTISTTGVAPGSISATELNAGVVGLLQKVGSVILWMGNKADGNVCPAGYLDADGSAVSRSTYEELYNLYSNTGASDAIYGNGDGTTTFNLPSMLGRFIRGLDTTAAIDVDVAARTDRGDGTGGANVGSLQGEQSKLVSHAHTQQGTFQSGNNDATHTHAAAANTARRTGSTTATAGAGQNVSDTFGSPSSGTNSVTHTHNTTISGATTTAVNTNETRGVNIAVLYCVLASPSAAAGSVALVNTILTGAGVPSDTLGNDGDVYYDTTNLDLYTKSGGSWTLSTSVLGPGQGYVYLFDNETVDDSPISLRVSAGTATTSTNVTFSGQSSNAVTITDTSATTLPTVVAGERITISDATDGDNNGLYSVTSITTPNKILVLAKILSPDPNDDAGADTITIASDYSSNMDNVYIQDYENGVTDVSSDIATWDDSTTTQNRGYLRLTSKGDPTAFMLFKVTGATTDATDAAAVTNATWTAQSGTTITLNDLVGSTLPTVTLGERILISGASTAANNGTYTVTGITVANQTIILSKDSGTPADDASADSITVAHDLYQKLVVTHVVSSADNVSQVFDDAIKIDVFFSRTGDAGWPGLEYRFDDTDQADTQPSANGDIKLNNTTASSVTKIMIEDNDINAVDVSTELISWDDSTSTALYGTITVREVGTPGNFAIYDITTASDDNAGWVTFNVTHSVSNFASGTSFADNVPLAIAFSRTGNKGDTGSTGATGPTGTTGAAAVLSLDYQWNTSTLDEDPTSGKLLITGGNQLNFSETDRPGSTVTSILALLDNSTSTTKGFLHVIDTTDATNFNYYSFTGTISDAGTYDTLSGVTLEASNGTIANDTTVSVVFISNGDAGSGANSFQTHDTPAGTDPVASSATDTLTWAATAPITITGDSGTDTITVDVTTTSASAEGVVELATTAEATTGTDTARAVTPAGLAAATRGKQTIYIDGGALTVPGTNGCQLVTREYSTSLPTSVCAFDTGTEEAGFFKFTPPKGWDEGVIQFAEIHWSIDTGGGAAETIHLDIECGSFANDDALAIAGITDGTEQSYTDTWIANDDLHVIDGSGTDLTVHNATEGDEIIMCKIDRDVASDDLAGDLDLIGLKITLTTDAATDD